MNTKILFFILLGFLLIKNTDAQQFVQQGPKLVGTNFNTGGWQGFSVAISKYGNTAIVGARLNNGYIGTAWIYTRIGNTWYQQARLEPTGNSGSSQFGSAVAISQDGNTAVVGGLGDSSYTGAAWVFTRVGSAWYQQGPKLVGTNDIQASAGYAVAISGDGNTIIVGGYSDSYNIGAAWIFTRVGAAWHQQGNKLVGTGAVGASQQGVSVALSGDGNTAMLGGWQDNAGEGAVWVFTRSGSSWNQQGDKLVGSNIVGAGGFANVALSDKGNTALIGASRDDNGIGAVYVFTRVGNTWSQQGSKLIGTGAVGDARQGQGVGISGDGNTILDGGYYDDNQKGAGWIFQRIGNTWYQTGSKFTGSDVYGSPQIGVSASLSWDGNTAIMGGWMDSLQTGAAWVFVRSNSYQVDQSNYNIDKILIGGQTTLDTIIISPLLKSSASGNKILSSNTAKNITITLDTIYCDNNADLEFMLSHQGITDTLINISGSNGSNFINTVLNDTASNFIGNGTSPFTGSYKPSSPLAKFDSVDPSGSWVLKVYNSASSNSGNLKSWGITLNVISKPTLVKNEPPVTPKGFKLFQNYPNPFNPSTTIQYNLSLESKVNITIYNVLGEKVKELVNSFEPAGNHQINFIANGLSSGVYLYRIIASSVSGSTEFLNTKKLILLK